MNTWEIPDERFRAVERLSKGGMADVWVALVVATGEKVVAKRPRPDRMLDDETRGELIRRFDREVRLLKKIKCRGVTRLRADGGWPNDPWFVMDYADGPNLDAYVMRHRALPVDVAAAIMVDLLEILRVVHAAKAVHRDIKPFNVAIDLTGRIYLLDFGIAYREGSEETRLTKLGSTPGTPGYTAPEAIKGIREVTAAADTYSCGCLLYFLLARQPPFPTHQGDLERNHAEVVPRRINERLRPDVPEPLADLLARMLEKDPKMRPEVAEALRILRRYLPVAGALAPDPVLEPDPTAWHRGEEAVQPAPVPEPQTRRRTASRPGRIQFRGMVEAARQEVGTGKGPATTALADAMLDARKAWGHSDADVLRAELCLADSELEDENWLEAGDVYRMVTRLSEDHATGPLRDVYIAALFGRAECELAAQYVEEAFQFWNQARLILRPSDPAELFTRRDRIAEELAETGFTPAGRSADR
ncbi:serine/threonine-protein kinase [Sphaerisporangium corydalis]|uniref:non-specific serine/threonine protein kinase n=1 Tax=Sphaerisporangium corydalis TaxID=1441875 RepID=A0ABV9ES75_9ACTN|nr:serine/threonine-protein kinase [Sphaerisporangium corydalis]